MNFTEKNTLRDAHSPRSVAQRLVHTTDNRVM